MQGISLETEKRKFRITGIAPILGSIPPDKEIYSNYIATKARKESDESVAERNAEAAQEDAENVLEDEGKYTEFYRDPETKAPLIKGYQIKGFFKEAASAIQSQINLKQSKSKIDKYVFIEEKDIKFYRDGVQIMDTEGFLERPLRAETMQGPRVTLAKSEKIDEGYTIEFTVEILKNEKTKTSTNIDMDVIEAFLDYGKYKGLLQWRNAGYGSFTYEVIE